MDKLVKKKLNEILDKDCNNGKGKLTQKQLSEFEKRYDVSLPEDYKDFLISFYSCYVNDDYFFPMIERSKLTPDDNMETIYYFYNLEFETKAKEYVNIYGINTLPIGESAGDYICIGVQPNNKGKIYLLYHEDCEREDGLFLIANSFKEFILSFRYVDSNNDNDDIDNIQMSLSPELDMLIKKHTEELKNEK